MTLTSASWAPASTAASSAAEPLGAGRGVCAIHQPNLFPRLSTLAKLYAADRWIVLDDVQFARRDYQHRARLAALDDPGRQQWLTLPTHLPHGRPTLVSQARLVDSRRSRRTVELLSTLLPSMRKASPCCPSTPLRIPATRSGGGADGSAASGA
ncbi:WbqC family protein [Streptomyces sp. A012304]|uniref:WbqC family protein n=1 Tax=Streptomyces sp. A012304 TaxID=375446 RepID=UPI0022318758|nr:WbqC family protein [Streptomyces sp. A012304]